MRESRSFELPEDQVDKSVITYPCDEACLEKLEEEKNDKNQ